MSGEISSNAVVASNRRSLPPWSWPVLVSALAWAVIYLAVPPAQQDFPLGDDWAFARGAIWFAHGKGVHYSNWASMPQLGQWIWAWPFLHIIPWPHVALRLSVLVLSWFALAAFCDLLQREKVPDSLAAFAACVLALTPLFFISQGTFMTDVPALSFALLALGFYSRAVAGKNFCWLLPATGAAVLAVATRQTMIAVPVAAAVPLLRNPQLRNPIYCLSLLTTVVVSVLINNWFSHRPDVLLMQSSFRLERLYFRPFLALHWCGLVVLPLCALNPGQKNWIPLIVGSALMLLGVYYLSDKPLAYGGKFPYCTGMISLEGTYSDGLVVGDRDILLTSPVRWCITILGCIGGAYFLAAFWEMARAKTFPGMLLVFTVLQFLIAQVVPAMMDRYLEVIFPGAIFVVAARRPVVRPIWGAGFAVAALAGFISVALIHDWLAWNAVRWDLGKKAMEAGKLQPDDIEGGFEWNGWYASTNPDQPLLSGVPRQRGDDDPLLTLRFTRYYFPMVNGHFALAFSQPTNSTVIASLPYSRWLPPAKKEMLFLQAIPSRK